MDRVAEYDMQVGRSSVSSSFYVAALLCFGAITLDGLDTALVGIAGPAIVHGFSVPASALTAAFVLTNVGAAIGYVLSGPLIRRWNERLVLVRSVALFGVLTLATAAAPSIYWLAAFRLFTAIALGCALPAAISLVVARVDHEKIGAATVFVTSGLAFGGVVGGTVGGTILQRCGWQGLFVLGGVLPLIFSNALVWLLPEPAEPLPTAFLNDRTLPDGGLLTHHVRLRSFCLWAFSFLIFAEVYALLFWIPILLTGFGHATSSASLGVAVFSIGGLIASVILIGLSRVWPVARVLMAYVVLALAGVMTFSLGASAPWAAFPAIALCGGSLIGCCTGQSALAAMLYPHSMRATGVGVTAAFGRGGSIVGPAAMGSLLALGWSTDRILLVSTAPIFLAAVALGAFEVLRRLQGPLRDSLQQPAVCERTQL